MNRAALPLITALLFLFPAALQAQQAPIDGPGSTISQAPRPDVPDSPPMPYGLPLLARFDLLPTLRDTKCVQDSSYDRQNKNGDFGQFLRMDGKNAVLADIRGPGCIYRFWSANATGTLHIYFDDQTVPAIECPMQSLFLGKIAPFVPPLVGHKSGGFYCYFPMPFQKRCLIEVTDPGPLYYHVQYQLFPDSARVRTFTTTLSREDKEALKTVLSQWNHTGSDPKPLQKGEQTIGGETALPAGATQELALLKNPGEIEALRFQIEPADVYTLRQTVLRIYWDGAEKPAVEAPLGDFFGSGFGDQRFHALPTSMTNGGYVCYWPMPFGKSARITLTNYGKMPLNRVSWSASYTPLSEPLKNAGYFHAQWHIQTNVSGERFHILQTTGRGVYVGEHTDMQGDRGIWFLEGNEKMFIDGETFPSIIGTGTEDFYTSGWYFDEGTFSRPLHGCIVKDEAISRVSAYRYQFGDCVPFQRSIVVDIQHGPVNDYPGSLYSCVAYWYQDSPQHDWSPIVPSQLQPTFYHRPGAIEAEAMKWSGEAKTADASQFAEEPSGGEAVLLGAGVHTGALQAPKAGSYVVQWVQPELPGAAKLGGNWAVGADAALPAAPLGSLGSGAENIVTALAQLQAGANTISIAVPEGQTLPLDCIVLQSAFHPNSLPAADLKVLEAKGGDTSLQAMDSYGPGWDPQQFWFVARAPGAETTLELPAQKPGRYALSVYLTAAKDYGIVQVLLDGKPLGNPIDCYAPKVSALPEKALGSAELTPGPHKLTFRMVGKNADSSSYLLGVDAVGIKQEGAP